ncbi:MAG TPA: dihydrofolate reductase family protein [Solirubrobacteraceae bacterium]|jgi:dihydrofolate reductase|nr:dihydrofolate reductase family protein [Solirubrobacteraceae bacterium]
MRKLIVTEFVSLDGVMEAPGGEAGYPHAGWVAPLFSDELGAYKEQEQLDVGLLVLGRKTYESFVGAWPQREGAMAEKINTMPKLVASTTLGSSEWHDTTVVHSDLEGAVGALKRQDGDPILVAGSRSVVHALLAAGLVDQINLQVFPLLLGSGMSVYPQRGEPVRLELISSRALGSGVTLASYGVVG